MVSQSKPNEFHTTSYTCKIRWKGKQRCIPVMLALDKHYRTRTQQRFHCSIQRRTGLDKYPWKVEIILLRPALPNGPRADVILGHSGRRTAMTEAIEKHRSHYAWIIDCQFKRPLHIGFPSTIGIYCLVGWATGSTNTCHRLRGQRQ